MDYGECNAHYLSMGMGLPGKYGTLIVLLSLLLFAGCIGEDRDHCPPQGYRLLFYYPGNGSTDIFPDKIHRVVMNVYDQQQDRILTEQFSRAQLEGYQGATLDLPPGDYTVVCWGNTDGYSTLSGEDHLSSGRLYQSEWTAGLPVTDFDSLYYGSKTIRIETGTEQTDRLDFVSAHINMEVHIAGYNDVAPVPTSGQGFLRLENIAVGYDFEMDLRPEKSVMLPVWTDERDPEMLDFHFRVLRFSSDTAIILYVLGTDGQPIARVALAEFLAEHEIRVEGVNEITVPIYIRFREGGYSVTVDGWETVPVDPIGPLPETLSNTVDGP